MVPDLVTSIYVASATAALGLLAHILRPRFRLPRFPWPKFEIEIKRQRHGNIQVTDVMAMIASAPKSRKGLEIACYFVIKRKY